MTSIKNTNQKFSALRRSGSHKRGIIEEEEEEIEEDAFI